LLTSARAMRTRLSLSPPRTQELLSPPRTQELLSPPRTRERLSPPRTHERLSPPRIYKSLSPPRRSGLRPVPGRPRRASRGPCLGEPDSRPEPLDRGLAEHHGRRRRGKGGAEEQGRRAAGARAEEGCWERGRRKAAGSEGGCSAPPSLVRARSALARTREVQRSDQRVGHGAGGSRWRRRRQTGRQPSADRSALPGHAARPSHACVGRRHPSPSLISLRPLVSSPLHNRPCLSRARCPI
jgi:hypothetical protein